MALKLDIGKAYDRPEWNFIKKYFQDLSLLTNRLIGFDNVSSGLTSGSLLITGLEQNLHRKEVSDKMILYPPTSLLPELNI